MRAFLLFLIYATDPICSLYYYTNIKTMGGLLTAMILLNVFYFIRQTELLAHDVRANWFMQTKHTAHDTEHRYYLFCYYYSLR